MSTRANSRACGAYDSSGSCSATACLPLLKGIVALDPAKATKAPVAPTNSPPCKKKARHCAEMVLLGKKKKGKKRKTKWSCLKRHMWGLFHRSYIGFS
jgi:hypothetical protein